MSVQVPAEVLERQRADFGRRGVLLVAAVIVHDQDRGRVLLLQMGPGDRFAPGAWDLPVGKQEPGEQIPTTAARELREETGLMVRVEDLRLVHAIHGAWGVQAPHGFLTLVFAVHRWDGELVNAGRTPMPRSAGIPSPACPRRWWTGSIASSTAI